MVFFIFYFFPKTKLLPLVIKFYRWEYYIQIHVGTRIVPSYVDAHGLKKGRGWPLLDKGYSLSFNSSEPPLRPSYWLFRVAITSLHISCINILGCVIWLEKIRLHRCFYRIQRVIGLTKFQHNLRFGIIRSWVDIANDGKKTHVLLLPKSSPPLDACTCQLGPAMITSIHFRTWLCLALHIF